MTEGTDSTVTSHTNRNLLQTNKSGQNAKHNENTKQTKQKTHQCISNQSQQSTPGELQTSSQVTSHCEKTQQIAKDRNDADVVTVLVRSVQPASTILISIQFILHFRTITYNFMHLNIGGSFKTIEICT